MAKARSLFLLCASWAFLLRATSDRPAIEKDVLEAVAEAVQGRGVGRCGDGSVLLRPADDPSASIDWLFPDGWPPDFSLATVIKPSTTTGTLLTLYDGFGVEHLQLRLVDGSLDLMYKPPSAPQLNLLFEAGILPSQWSILGLSVKGDAATLITNCREISQPLLRTKNSTLPSDGIILLGQPLLENSTGFHIQVGPKMFTLGLLLTLGTVGLGLQNLPAVLPSKNDSIEPDLDLIPISIYMQLTEIAEFSNQIIRMMDFPWLTSIQNQDGSHLCSANILTPLYVLSTCQCLVVPTGAVMVPFTPRRPEDIFIIAGVSRLNLPLKMLMKKGQVRDVVSISIHPRCTPFQKFDFAVAELSHFLYFSPYIRPMSWLPYDRMRDRPYFCSTGGWRQSLPGWDRPEPYFEDMVVNEYVILRNDECPGMPELQEGAQFVCARISSMEKSLYSFDGQEETQSKTPWDHGSGLLCDEKVIAILSHHDKKQMTSIFTSLGPAVSFLRPYLIEFDRSISNAQSHTFSLSSYPLLLLIGLSSIIYRTL